MNRHASLNRIYRLIWNAALGAFVPAAETARGRGKGSKRRLAALAGAFYATFSQAGPLGGQVTGGNGKVIESGTTTTIEQSSQNLSLSWQSFNVASQETVDFVQPNSTAIAVNRVLDPNASVILGHLNANGQVYLINPNGVIFGKGAEINVGGLVASALELDPTSMGNTKSFSGSGSGSVINEGSITAVGGTVVLLGSRVGNTGVISAQLGSVGLGAGSAATLTFSGTRLVSMQVDQSVLNSEASNGGLIRADGGTVLMTAGAQKSLLASVVNNTGVIEARTVESHDGTITLLGGMSAGTVELSGTLDASAPAGGNGGSIDTSAAHVEVANGSKVTTAAALGLNGTWTLDPKDFTVAASGGDMTGAQLSTSLSLGSVNILSSAGASGTQGNVNLDDTVSWSANTLTLNAQNNININSTLNGTGIASLALAYGQGAVNAGNLSTYNVNAPVNLPAGQHFSTKLGSDGGVTQYTVITSLGNAGDATTAPGTATLQGMAASSNLAGNFALGSNINATTTSGWNAGAGFTPIGNSSSPFTGHFDGLGHSISNLTLNQGGNYGGIGLFGQTSVGTTIANIGLVGGTAYGPGSMGGLVGVNNGTINNSTSSVAMSGAYGFSYIGGLVGNNTGTIRGSSASGSVVGSSYIGGLVGMNSGTISKSSSSSSIDGYENGVGGLVGQNESAGTITSSFATGAVTGDPAGSPTGLGGLVGRNEGAISGSYAAGAVNAPNSGNRIGGLVGENDGSIATSYAIANVTSYAPPTGGLVGMNYGSISNSYATGTVAGYEDTGGLVGTNIGTITASYSKVGAVSGGAYVGGLVGYNAGGTISQSYAKGSSVSGAYGVGGLVGINSGGVINNSYAIDPANAPSQVGGLVGINNNAGSISNSYAGGSVTGSSYTGALVGQNFGTISNSFYDNTVNTGMTGIGGPTPVADVAGTVWGMSPSQFETPANFTSIQSANGGVDPNWNVTNTWIVYAGESYPLLRTFMTALTVGGGTALTLTYNASAFAPTRSQLNYSSTPDMSLLFGTVAVTGNAQGAVNAGTYSYTASGLYSNQDGYILSYVPSTVVISPAALTVTGTSTANKVYDGTTVAYLAGGGLSGVLGSDSVTLVQSGSYASKNVGTAISVTGTNSLTGAEAADYSVSNPSFSLTGAITPAPLTVSGSIASKVYDGTTAAPLTGGVLVGVVSGDTVILTAAGSFASKNAGTSIPVTSSDTIGGASASDYTLVEPTGLTGNITPASVTVSGTTVGDKIYNGTTSAPLGGGSLVGIVSGDAVTLTQAGSFASKNAGTGIAVTANDSLAGTNAGDYTIIEPTGLSGTISPASLTVSGTTVGDKVYNGTTAAPLTGGSLVGLVSGDTVTLTQAGSFASKNAGTGIAVTANDSLAGTNAGDYTIIEPTGLTGAITPASLTVSGTTVGDKVYNGTTAAPLTGGSLVGLVSGDTVNLTQAGSFASKNAGTGILVMATDSLSGTDAANYTITEPTGLTGTISPASLTVSGSTVPSKIYNGSASTSLVGGTLVGVVSGDTVTLSQSGTFASTAVGTGIAVTATDGLSGADASDYSIVEPTGLTGSIVPASGGGSVASGGSGGSNALVLLATNARSQIMENFIYPQLGANPQLIDPSTSIQVIESATDSDSTSHKATTVNVSMKIGATGTLKIENGGLRLPSNLVVGNE